MMKSISTWKQELTKGAHAARLAALTAQQIDVPELRRVRQLVDLQRGALHQQLRRGLRQEHPVGRVVQKRDDAGGGVHLDMRAVARTEPLLAPAGDAVEVAADGKSEAKRS